MDVVQNAALADVANNQLPTWPPSDFGNAAVAERTQLASWLLWLERRQLLCCKTKGHLTQMVVAAAEK